jgi:hypothetical protein
MLFLMVVLLLARTIMYVMWIVATVGCATMTLGSAHASKGFTAKIASHRMTTTKEKGLDAQHRTQAPCARCAYCLLPAERKQNPRCGQAESLVSKRKQNGNMGYTAMTFRVNVPATKTTARIDQEHGK